MQNPARVCSAESICSLYRVIDDRLYGAVRAGDELLQRPAGNVFHRDEIHSLGLSDFMYMNQVGMIYRESGFGFLQDAKAAPGWRSILPKVS